MKTKELLCFFLGHKWEIHKEGLPQPLAEILKHAEPELFKLIEPHFFIRILLCKRCGKEDERQPRGNSTHATRPQ